MKNSLLHVAILATTAALSAQNVQDFYYNCATGATTRGGVAGTSLCQVVMRFDSEDYIGWGNPVLANPPVTVSGYEITGCEFVMQDQNDSTIENFFLHFYGEDPANPSFPNFQPTDPPGFNSLLDLGPFPSASTGTAGGTISAYVYTFNFTTPLTRPAGQDFFAALELPANPGWAATDGLSQHINLGVSANFPAPTQNVFDLKGPGIIANGVTNTYGLSHDVTNGIFGAAGPRQYNWKFFVAAGVGRGIVTAETNQGSYTISNTAPGTGSFFSALHPDATSSPLNGGRVDNVNFVYFGAAPGDLVFFLIAFGFQNPEIPLVNLLPGATGVVCLDLPSMQTAALAISTGGGTDSYRWAFTAGQRFLLTGANLTWQAVAVNPVTLGAIASPCAWQRY